MGERPRNEPTVPDSPAPVNPPTDTEPNEVTVEPTPDHDREPQPEVPVQTVPPTRDD